MDKKGDLHLEAGEIEEVLNEYFISVFTKAVDVTQAEVREEVTATLEELICVKEELLDYLY